MKSKKILAGLVSAAMLMTAVSVPEGFGRINELTASVSASADASGIWGTNTWEFDENSGTLSINGSGEIKEAQMYDGSKIGNYPWEIFNDRITKVVISDGITAIPQQAFEGCKDLSDVSIPDSVERIDFFAFQDTKALENGKGSDGVYYIDKWLIEYDEEITKGVITVKEGTVGIAYMGLEYTPYQTYDIENSVDYVTGIVLPEGLKYLNCYALGTHENIKELTIPKSVVSIANGAMNTLNRIEKITILNPDCEIYDSAYTICSYRGDVGGSVEWVLHGTIYGYKNSTAQAYAEKYGYKFEALDGGSHEPGKLVTIAEKNSSSGLFMDFINGGHPSTFTVSKKCQVYQILTWHFNKSMGVPAGTISLYDGDELVGTWEAQNSGISGTSYKNIR